MYPANIFGNISPLPSRKEGSTAHYIDPTAILLFVGKTKQKTGKNRRLCGRLNVYWRKERRVPPQQRKQLASTCFVIIFGDKNTAFRHATCRKGNLTRTTLLTILMYLTPFIYF